VEVKGGGEAKGEAASGEVLGGFADNESRRDGALHQKAVAGPIQGFVQRGELMLERMRTLCDAGNFKALRREALKMKALAAKMENARLISLAQTLASQAERSDARHVERTLAQLQQRLNNVLNYSVRGMLVHNTLTELAEDLRLAAKSDEPQTALIQMSKASAEFQQLSDYLSIRKPGGDMEGGAATPVPRAPSPVGNPVAAPFAAASPAARASANEPNADGVGGDVMTDETEELQCKATVAMCVDHGKELLEAIAQAQRNGTLNHSAACRLVADTFTEVVFDLGRAAESDKMAMVSQQLERVNSRFFHVMNVVARNAMVAPGQGEGSTSGAMPIAEAPSSLAGPAGGRASHIGAGAAVLDQTIALEQFGGDVSFWRQMCTKFVSSGKGVIERISSAVEAASKGEGMSELRREAHSMKGAASTIGAMLLSQAALDLQLAAESDASGAILNELAGQVQHHFVLVCTEQERLVDEACDPIKQLETAKMLPMDARRPTQQPSGHRKNPSTCSKATRVRGPCCMTSSTLSAPGRPNRL